MYFSIETEDGLDKYYANFDRKKLLELKEKVIDESGVVLQKNAVVEKDSDLYNKLKDAIVDEKVSTSGKNANITYLIVQTPRLATYINDVLNGDKRGFIKILNNDSRDEILTLNERINRVKKEYMNEIDPFKRTRLGAELSDLITNVSYNVDKKDPKEFYEEARKLIDITPLGKTNIYQGDEKKEGLTR